MGTMCRALLTVALAGTILSCASRSFNTEQGAEEQAVKVPNFRTAAFEGSCGAEGFTPQFLEGKDGRAVYVCASDSTVLGPFTGVMTAQCKEVLGKAGKDTALCDNVHELSREGFVTLINWIPLKQFKLSKLNPLQQRALRKSANKVGASGLSYCLPGATLTRWPVDPDYFLCESKEKGGTLYYWGPFTARMVEICKAFEPVKACNTRTMAYTQGYMAQLIKTMHAWRVAGRDPSQIAPKTELGAAPNPAPNAPPPTASVSEPPPIVAPLPDKVELRGAWLTNAGSEILYDKALLRDAFVSMKAWGLNAAYIVVWHKGFTLYPSEVNRKLSGEAVEPDREVYRSWDMLAEAVKLGKEFGISVIPWFEWGLKIPEGHNAHAFHPEWFTKQSNGEIYTGEHPRFGYLNPTLDEVRAFMASLVTELLEKYDVQGIQFDDHLSLGIAYGYDETTKSVYRSRHGREAPSNHREANWKAFRSEMVTDFLHYVFRAAQAKRPNLILSVSPIGFPFSYDEHLVNWPRWLEMGLINEVIIQVYRENIHSFRKEMSLPSILNARGKVKSVGIGILTGYPHQRWDIDFILDKTRAAKSMGFGVVYFYFGSMKEWIPPSDTPEERRAKLSDHFREPARSH
jgi:uncharacterized lipoprotein YddW (UPF0748 family)